jgi:hypothetical protein
MACLCNYTATSAPTSVPNLNSLYVKWRGIFVRAWDLDTSTCLILYLVGGYDRAVKMEEDEVDLLTQRISV